MRSQEEKELERKLRGVMDFYVTTYLEYYSARAKKEIAKQNIYVETDMMDARINDRIKEIGEEVADKFHHVCMLILDVLMAKGEQRVREFELLLIDLLQRTLVKDLRDSKKKEVHPIIINVDRGGNN